MEIRDEIKSFRPHVSLLIQTLLVEINLIGCYKYNNTVFISLQDILRRKLKADTYHLPSNGNFEEKEAGK